MISGARSDESVRFGGIRRRDGAKASCWPCVGTRARSQRKLPVEHAYANLKQVVRRQRGPAHLLRLRHPLVDHLIDCRLGKRAGDSQARAPALPIVGHRVGVVLQVPAEFADPLAPRRAAPRRSRWLALRQRPVQDAQHQLQSPHDLQGTSVPQSPLKVRAQCRDPIMLARSTLPRDLWRVQGPIQGTCVAPKVMPVQDVPGGRTAVTAQLCQLRSKMSHR